MSLTPAGRRSAAYPAPGNGPDYGPDRPRRATIGGVIANLVPTPVTYVCGHQPACATTMRVQPADTRTPMHNCPAAALMSLPMIREGERANVTLVEREDYEGADHGKIRLDAEGRPFMRSEVEHADGHTDVFVYAPTATWFTQS
jgi:hypothetical protein